MADFVRSVVLVLIMVVVWRFWATLLRLGDMLVHLLRPATPQAHGTYQSYHNDGASTLKDIKTLRRRIHSDAAALSKKMPTEQRPAAETAETPSGSCSEAGLDSDTSVIEAFTRATSTLDFRLTAYTVDLLFMSSHDRTTTSFVDAQADPSSSGIATAAMTMLRAQSMPIFLPQDQSRGKLPQQQPIPPAGETVSQSERWLEAARKAEKAMREVGASAEVIDNVLQVLQGRSLSAVYELVTSRRLSNIMVDSAAKRAAESAWLHEAEVALARKNGLWRTF